MIQSIKNIVTALGYNGDIILYRDSFHKKKGLCEYLAKNVQPTDIIVTYSDGAFALYLARALPNNTIHTCYNGISPDYGELLEKQINLVLHPNYRRAVNYKNFLQEHPEYVEINQYTDEKCVEYYAQHFVEIYEQELKNLHIDAFAEYGHSGATLAGVIKANIVDWDFIMATLDFNTLTSDKINYRNHMNSVKDKITHVEFCTKINTFLIGQEIERVYPEFGNVYEATRSIAAAFSYLEKNPGKTVLVYVGDSIEKEGTKFRGNSVSYTGVLNLLMRYNLLISVQQGKICDRHFFEDYYESANTLYDKAHKKYIFTDVLKCMCDWITRYNLPKVQYIKLYHILQDINSDIHDSTLNMISAYVKNDLQETVAEDKLYGNNVLLQDYVQNQKYTEKSNELLSYMQQRGVL